MGIGMWEAGVTNFILSLALLSRSISLLGTKRATLTVHKKKSTCVSVVVTGDPDRG